MTISVGERGETKSEFTTWINRENPRLPPIPNRWLRTDIIIEDADDKGNLLVRTIDREIPCPTA